MDEQMIGNKNSEENKKRFKQPQFHRSFVRLYEVGISTVKRYAETSVTPRFVLRIESNRNG